MLDRFLGIARVLRPRALARTAKSVEDLIVEAQEIRRTVKTVAAAGEQLADQKRQLEAAVKALEASVEAVRLRESQLVAIYRSDIEMEPYLQRLSSILDADAICAHVRCSLARATIHADPFPHLVVDNLLPSDFYDALIRGLPPIEMFADKPANKQRMVVPFEMAPAY